MTPSLRQPSLLIALAALVFSASGCSTIVPPGYVAVAVNNVGSQRGVQDLPVHVGRVWYDPLTEDVYPFPTFNQRVIWTKDPGEGHPTDESITFNSMEGATLNSDIAILFHIPEANVPKVFVTFRHDLADIQETYLHDTIRNSLSLTASTMKITDILGPKKREFEDAVTKDANARMEPKGIVVDSISMVGKPRPDDRVQQEINQALQASISAVQAQNKVQQVQAEARQKVAEAKGFAQSLDIRTKAQAAANIRLAQSISPGLISYNNSQRWDGKMPQVVGSGGAMPMIQIPAGR